MHWPHVRVGLPVRATISVTIVIVLGLFLIDGGSVAITRASVPDDARDAGYAASEAVEGVPRTQQAAVVAYEAATRRGTAAALHIERKGFTVYPDGKVTLTVTRSRCLPRQEKIRGRAGSRAISHLPAGAR